MEGSWSRKAGAARAKARGPAGPPGSPAPPESARVLACLEELGLEPQQAQPFQSHDALFLPALGRDGHPFLFKYFLSCPVGLFEPGLDPEGDCRRREAAFYRFLDVVDRDRVFLNVPRLVITDQADPPRWVLLEGIPGLHTAREETPRPDWLLDAIASIQRIPLRLTQGRRGLSLERWDPYAHREAIFKMREQVEPKVGPKAWDLLARTLNEAREWTDSQDPVLVCGDFQEDSLLLDEDGRIYLQDFRRVGWGNPDHDFSWLWVGTSRGKEYKDQLLQRYCASMGPSERTRVEWAIRSTAIYRACVALSTAETPGEIAPAGELLERAILGGPYLFS